MWWEKYYGIPYQHKVFDCANLVENVYKQELGIDLVLPQHQKYHNLPDAHPEIDKYQEQTEFEKVGEPHEYDVILMRRGGELHFGIYFESETGYVLHNMRNCGVIAEKIRNVIIVGFYKYAGTVFPGPNNQDRRKGD